MSKHTNFDFAAAEAVDNMRDSARRRVLMQATIISVGGPQRVYVKDLTGSGARLHCDRRLEQDWDVVFKRGELFVAARVAWATKEEAGIQFYHDLPDDAFASHR